MVAGQSPRHQAFGACALPDDFVPEIIEAEDGIQNHLQIVGGGGVAVDVEAAGGFEDAAEFNQAGGHHDEVGEHGSWADDFFEGVEEVVYDAWVGGDDVEEGLLGGWSPGPGIIEGGNLSVGGGAGLVFEEDVVAAGAVEGRVEVDEVYRLGGHGAEDGEVVAVVEGVHHALFYCGLAMRRNWIAVEVMRRAMAPRLMGRRTEMRGERG